MTKQTQQNRGIWFWVLFLFTVAVAEAILFWFSFEAAIFLFVFPVLGIATILTVYRLLIGPHLADRILSLDQLTTIGVGIAATYAILTDETAFLDVAVVLALIGFLGTAAFAYYAQKVKITTEEKASP